MNNILTTISFSIFSNKGVYALLLGSGISKNSGIPTGWDIVVDLIKKLAEINKEDCSKNPEKWFFDKYGEEANYSTILSRLVKSPSERMNFLKPYFEPSEDEIEQGLKQPTEAHKNIAKLIKKGYIKVVVTTNFDRLLENALLAEGVDPIVIRHPDDIDGALPLVHSDFVIVKINGDYLDSRFLNTIEELSEYSKKLNDYILRIINEFGIISSGWSGKWDIGLVNSIRKCENFRFSSYWTYVGKCEDELKEIAKIRKGEVVETKGSDDFFRDINDNISALENINQNNPLTNDIAVARLKKYIVKDEYRINLHDLIQDQLSETLEKIRTKDNVGLYPNRENLMPIITHYFQSIENILHLIINGVYWARKEHYYLFTNILRSISEPLPSATGSFYEETKHLLQLPSLLTLCTIGLSALKQDNFEIINECFNIKVRESDSDYSDELYLIDKVHPCMVESKVMNSILDKNYKTPLSTYLRQTLEPFFVEHLYSAKEFQDKFDLFEYLLSLNYFHLVGPKWGHDWAPWGEYQWRKFGGLREKNYILSDFAKQAEKEKDNWIVLKSGMFNGRYENFEDIRNKLDEFLKKIYLP